MAETVKLCMQCAFHPASTRLVGVPCKILGMPLKEARQVCKGELWEQGHETPIAKQWMGGRRAADGLRSA